VWHLVLQWDFLLHPQLMKFTPSHNYSTGYDEEAMMEWYTGLVVGKISVYPVGSYSVETAMDRSICGFRSAQKTPASTSAPPNKVFQVTSSPSKLTEPNTLIRGMAFR
jgi:hypothetical protein